MTIKPRVIKHVHGGEYWSFRGQLFYACIFSDGVVQLYHAQKSGDSYRLSGIMPVNSHNTHDREAAIKWLNENIG